MQNLSALTVGMPVPGNAADLVTLTPEGCPCKMVCGQTAGQENPPRENRSAVLTRGVLLSEGSQALPALPNREILLATTLFMAAIS